MGSLGRQDMGDPQPPPPHPDAPHPAPKPSLASSDQSPSAWNSNDSWTKAVTLLGLQEPLSKASNALDLSQPGF